MKPSDKFKKKEEILEPFVIVIFEKIWFVSFFSISKIKIEFFSNLINYLLNY